MTAKHLNVVATYSENLRQMRLDIKKQGLTDQEVLGILEMAKAKILEEMKSRQTFSAEMKR